MQARRHHADDGRERGRSRRRGRRRARRRAKGRAPPPRPRRLGGGEGAGGSGEIVEVALDGRPRAPARPRPAPRPPRRRRRGADRARPRAAPSSRSSARSRPSSRAVTTRSRSAPTAMKFWKSALIRERRASAPSAASASSAQSALRRHAPPAGRPGCAGRRPASMCIGLRSPERAAKACWSAGVKLPVGAAEISASAPGARRGSRRSRGWVLRPSQPASTYFTSSGQGRYLVSASPSCSTFMIARQVSRPMKSASSSGPIGWLAPSFSEVSIEVDRADALVERVDRLVDHRHQDAVDDEGREVLGRGRGLADLLDHPEQRLRRSPRRWRCRGSARRAASPAPGS